MLLCFIDWIFLKVYFLSATQTKDIGLVTLKWLIRKFIPSGMPLRVVNFALEEDRGLDVVPTIFLCFPFQARSLRGLHFAYSTVGTTRAKDELLLLHNVTQ